MRMWMVDPRTMCKQHLMGEHLELHMFIGSMKRKLSMRGYAEGNYLEPQSIYTRHEELVEEIARRGYKHVSPIQHIDMSYLPLNIYATEICREDALNELHRRCPECRKRWREIYGDKEGDMGSAEDISED